MLNHRWQGDESTCHCVCVCVCSVRHVHVPEGSDNLVRFVRTQMAPTSTATGVPDGTISVSVIACMRGIILLV